MTLLSAEGGKIIAQSAEAALTTISDRFDIVFLDPPFAMSIDELTEKIDGICADQALIYYEKSPNMPFSAPAHWQLEKHKQSGQIDACLYCVNRAAYKG